VTSEGSAFIQKQQPARITDRKQGWKNKKKVPFAKRPISKPQQSAHAASQARSGFPPRAPDDSSVPLAQYNQLVQKHQSFKRQFMAYDDQTTIPSVIDKNDDSGSGFAHFQTAEIAGVYGNDQHSYGNDQHSYSQPVQCFQCDV
jgi:hypothetical protein